MSIEQRLRNGLSANTEHLKPHLERELDMVLQRAHVRRRVRTAGFGVAAVAAVAAGVLWLPGVADSIRADDNGAPAVRPTQPTEATDGVPVLDSERGSAEDPAPLEPGRYAIPFIGAENAPWGEVEVPAGWGQDRLLLATGPDLDPHLRRVELLAVSWVAPDPCDVVMRPVKGRVTDIVAALTNQRRVQPSDARPVSIDGYSGQLVHFRVPFGLDVEIAVSPSRHSGSGPATPRSSRAGPTGCGSSTSRATRW